jgi:hypothetical protein
MRRQDYRFRKYRFGPESPPAYLGTLAVVPKLVKQMPASALALHRERRRA